MIFHILFDLIELVISPNRTGNTPNPERKLHQRDVNQTHQKPLLQSEEQRYRVYRLLELEVLFMAYMMQQDDKMITQDEAIIIKQRMTSHKIDLLESEYKNLERITQKLLSIEDIVYLIEQKEYTEGEVRDVLDLLIQINTITKRHTSIITKIRKELYNRYFY